MNQALKKALLIALKTFLVIIKLIVGVFVAYAVVFSLAVTFGAYYAYRQIQKPLREVQKLTTENPTETAFMAAYRQEKRDKGENDSLTQQFVPLDSISHFLKQAVIAVEDDGFYVHPGFDVTAILSAMDYNRAQNQVKRGASTITQQLAKNLFLSSERTFYRKALELGYTLLMEKYLGKDRILELYLNYAEWGPNIFGCEAAAQHHFKKSSRKLSLYEASRLAAMLAKPSTLNPHGSKSKLLWSRLKVMADNLYGKGLIGDSAYSELIGLPPPRKEAPIIADTTVAEALE